MEDAGDEGLGCGEEGEGSWEGLAWGLDLIWWGRGGDLHGVGDYCCCARVAGVGAYCCYSDSVAWVAGGGAVVVVDGEGAWELKVVSRVNF